MVATLPKLILRDTGEPTAPVDSINPDVPATPIADTADPTGAPAHKRQRTAPASPDLASAFAQYQQRCVEARAAFDAIVEENLRLVEDKGGLETELARTKTALGAAEQDAQAAVAHTQVLEGTVAWLNAAAAEDQAALLLWGRTLGWRSRSTRGSWRSCGRRWRRWRRGRGRRWCPWRSIAP